MSNPPAPVDPEHSDQVVPVEGVNYDFAHTRPAPENLYHYTNTDAGLSILRGRKIWATHFRYLNDIDEWLHIWNLTIKEVKSLEVEGASPESLNLIREVLLQVVESVKQSAMNSVPAFIASFCEDGDLLSQWRGYGRGGISLGFNFEKMNALHTNQESDYEIIPIEYDSEHIGERAKHGFRLATWKMFADHVGQWNCDEKEIRQRLGESQEWTNLLVGLSIFGSRYKNQAFEAENEWRAIRSAPVWQLKDEFRFRNGGMGVTPYLELDISDPTTGRPMVEENFLRPVPTKTKRLRRLSYS